MCCIAQQRCFGLQCLVESEKKKRFPHFHLIWRKKLWRKKTLAFFFLPPLQLFPNISLCVSLSLSLCISITSWWNGERLLEGSWLSSYKIGCCFGVLLINLATRESFWFLQNTETCESPTIQHAQMAAAWLIGKSCTEEHCSGFFTREYTSQS